MNRVTLYKFESPDIKITMEIYFNEENQLIFEGYDIGKKVNQLMGDLDYEYLYAVQFEEVKKLARLFDVNPDEKMNFLEELKKRFNGNDAYSKFGAFMNENDIVFESFTWR